jgi:hypothetical protein
MIYIAIFILLYLISKYIIPPFLAIFNISKSINDVKSRREIRSKINKMNIQDAEFDEKE